jgi:hypothetical protein
MIQARETGRGLDIERTVLVSPGSQGPGNRFGAFVEEHGRGAAWGYDTCGGTSHSLVSHRSVPLSPCFGGQQSPEE